jgi:hypothetical protein
MNSQNDSQLEPSIDPIEISASKNRNENSIIEKNKEPFFSIIRLSQVLGIHSAIEEFNQELGIPPLKAPYVNSKTDPGFQFVLRRNPIWVYKENQRLRCIGNIHAYLSLSSIFDQDTKIHSIEVFDVTAEQIKKNYLYEFLFMPALFGVHFSELDKLAEVARRANAAGLWEPPLAKKSVGLASGNDVDKYISKVYGVDKRKLKSKNVTHMESNLSSDGDPWESLL